MADLKLQVNCSVQPRTVNLDNPLQLFVIIMCTALDAKDGDTVYVTRSDDNGLKIQAHDPELIAALAAAQDVMDENRTLLQALA